MTEYIVKIAFWLRAFDSVNVEARTDAEAIECLTESESAALRKLPERAAASA